MKVHPIVDDALGNTSYLVDLGDGRALVVDPRRDVDPYLELADRLGVEITALLETHLHADFVSGVHELVAATNADVVAPADAGSGFVGTPVSAGRILSYADASIEVLSTPGHTPEHVAYLLRTDEGVQGGSTPVLRRADPLVWGVQGVFSGGSLIRGGAARTDLIAAERTTELARQQFRSLRRLSELPDRAALWPTHGAGSFCSAASPDTGSPATIGAERRTNPLLRIDDEDEFVRRLLAGYGSFPPYFLHLREVNRTGPALVADLDAPRALDPDEVSALVEAGAWLIDARETRRWAEAHPVGAVSIELRPAFASWLGWVVPFGSSIVLLVEETRRDEALTLARRIGYDGVLGWLDGGVEAWQRAGHQVATSEQVDVEAAMRRIEEGAGLVDVRQAAELEAVRIPTAEHLELGSIVAGATPAAPDPVVFCGHGERSTTAVSLLERSGIRAVSLVGGIQAWEAAGHPVER